MENKPGPAYRIQTQRLVIRCWEPADAALLKSAIDSNLDHLRPWMPWAHQEPTDLQTKVNLLRSFRGKFDLDQDFVYGIFSQDEARVLGGTGLHTRLGPGAREIGYWIHQGFTNQGLATETAAALTKVAFEVEGVERVEIHCAPENLRSAAVPHKLGFVHEATLRQRTKDQDGRWLDSMIWSMWRDRYPGSPCALTSINAFDAIGRVIILALPG